MENQESNDRVESDVIEERNSKSSGNIIVRRYQKKRFLGKGGFAKCFEVENM
jgi:polo-like kinase 1